MDKQNFKEVESNTDLLVYAKPHKFDKHDKLIMMQDKA